MFLLQSNGAPYVLKVYRRSLGQPLGTLLRIIAEQRRKYDMVTSWYNTGADMVLPGEFLVVHGPILGSPVVALLQPYLAGVKKDALRDFTDDDLLHLLARSLRLRQQFLAFATKTIAVFAAGTYCFDLIGKANLILIEQAEGCRLAIVDAGVFDLQTLQQESPQAFAQIQRHIARIASLLARLEGVQAQALQGTLPRNISASLLSAMENQRRWRV